MYIDSTPNDTTLKNIVLDHNLYYGLGGENVFRWTSIVNGLAAWQGAIFASNGVAGESHSVDTDPFFENDSGAWEEDVDFSLRWDSPAIDAGTSMTLPDGAIQGDYFGNKIYGPRDLGAVEYQPPYMMGVNKVNIGADVRVYGDGRFRNTRSPSGSDVALSIIPKNASTEQWVDVAVKDWNEQTKSLSLVSSTLKGSLTLSISGLRPWRPYTVKVFGDGNVVATTFQRRADQHGSISWDYVGDISTTTYFSVLQGKNVQ